MLDHKICLGYVDSTKYIRQFDIGLSFLRENGFCINKLRSYLLTACISYYILNIEIVKYW